ncbi:MAG: SUMF1/EgtB/PvdO family nonheme iron enzyme [Myxococcales bacterium]|nr:SUMF1/EgtB/PvdO family nonheme iron enzyme [Myxococcales bacterium]
MSISELETIEAWQAASAARREEIAQGLATSHGLEFEQVAPFRREDLPLASYRGMDGLFRFVLVPGGTYDMGLSEAELSFLTTLAEPHRAEPTFDQRWGGLFVDPSPMRPVTRVTVGPCLVAQNAMGDFALDDWRKEMGEALVGEDNDASTLPEDLEVAFAAHGFRLPTEAEWEWFARGGRTGELTYKGNVLPDEAFLKKLSREVWVSEGPDRHEERHARIANDFGLLGFGVQAELCASRWAKRPDLSPCGPGDFENRVIRGGAGATSPWQNPGEWQALLTAFRHRAGGLLLSVGIRPVRSVAD